MMKNIRDYLNTLETILYKRNISSSVWSNEEKANYLIECSLGIEKQIMKYCKLKPEDINDVSIKEYIEKLKIYNI